MIGEGCECEQFPHFGLNKASDCHQVGQKNRSVASTLMNNESSRSHSIFTVTVEILEKGWESVWESETLPGSQSPYLCGKFHSNIRDCLG